LHSQFPRIRSGAGDFGLSVDVVAAHITTYFYGHQTERALDYLARQKYLSREQAQDDALEKHRGLIRVPAPDPWTTSLQ
jgi:hypothetical protein